MALQFPGQGSQHSGSSLSLASTKVCSSMDEGDGPGSEGEEPCETMMKVHHCLIIFIWMLHPKSFLLAELVEDCPQVPASIAERYKVGRMIGDGNFAVVRECVERSTGREYALKIINKSKCRGKVRWFLKTILFSDDWVKVTMEDHLCYICGSQEHMIQNEVSILRKVKHPNIVLLIEEMDTYSELYLVMELVKVKHLTFSSICSLNFIAFF